MPKAKNLIRFIISFVIVYVIILLLHTTAPVKKLHVQFFCITEQFVFNMFHPGLYTDFKVYKPEYSQGAVAGDYDFSIFIYDRQERRRARQKSSVRPNVVLNQKSVLVSLGPYTFFLGLLLVAPTSWKRKLLSFFIGIFLLNLVLALKFSHIFADTANLEQGANSIWVGIASMLGSSFRTHEFMLIMVVIIWIISTLGLKEIKWFTK